MAGTCAQPALTSASQWSAPGRDPDALPRLLPTDPSAPLSLARHLEHLGPPARLYGADLVAAVTAAGLTGRGGAAFPVARKIAAVLAQGAPPVVVANAAEGEPAASKDKSLLAMSPHLVLDGLATAAHAIGAVRTIVYLHASPRLEALLRHALAERRAARLDRLSIEVVTAPNRFIAGEESAVVAAIDGGRAIPRVKPPRVFEQGVGKMPTLVHNVETLAQVGLIARYGPDWFRAVGTPEEPGSMLFSVGGAVPEPRVLEGPIGVPLDRVLASVGGATQPLQAVLFGGYHGGWIAASEIDGLRLCNAELRPAGAALGAGVIVTLPDDVCGLVETARVLRYLAGESAGQCGPCLHGLPHLADQFAAIARPRRSRRARRQLHDTADLLRGRGACAHPDGSLRFALSALTAFRSELDEHASGRCTARSRRAVLPIPAHARSD